MSGALLSAIEALPPKVQKAPPAQWVATIKSLTSKGVKQAEIDDCEVLSWLGGSQEKSLTREKLLAHVRARSVTVKEVELLNPRFSGYSHKQLAPGSRYREVLFIANSERANLTDRVEEIEYELEQFAFDLERLSSEPETVFSLERERSELMRQKPMTWDYARHHFTNEAGAHGKNLLAHGRTLEFGHTFLIEEIQSDWGQQGRMHDWANIPKGPFVTDTKLWAGLVARRLIQRAANNPDVTRVYWIRGSMKNGGCAVSPSALDDFYIKTVGSIIEKAIAKGGQKCRLDTLEMKGHLMAKVPCFDMTDEVRAVLKDSQPLYSLASCRPQAAPISKDEQERILHRARHMLGSARHVRLVAHLYDLATLKEVSGSYMNGVIQLSLTSREPELALDHECFHFAYDKLLSTRERVIINEQFAPGSQLNRQVTQLLHDRGQHAAAGQCSNAQEAAAHGFSLWAAGDLAMQPSPATSIFGEIRLVISDAFAWLRQMVQGHGVRDVYQIFGALDDGLLASQPGEARGNAPGPDIARTRRDRDMARPG